MNEKDDTALQARREKKQFTIHHSQRILCFNDPRTPEKIFNGLMARLSR